MRPQPKIIGTVTLTESKKFTCYSETASRTDYVTCEPQTVDLKWDGYWLFASFSGTLTATTFPGTSRTIGEPDRAGAQWSHAGFDPEALKALGFDVTLTAGRVEQVGTYSTDGPIMFYKAA